MNCLCGKKMKLISSSTMHSPDPITKLTGGSIKVWACPPEGCGRIFLEGTEIGGTWYQAEQNLKNTLFNGK